jgi:hypothetical protein
MANYFGYFPKTVYVSSSDTSSGDVVTNITSRFSFEAELKNNAASYYKYDIRDGDTPESIAYKVYDSPYRHWVILAFNDILDPQYDWPLDQRTFYNYIESKYSKYANTGQSGVTWAESNIYGYYKIEKQSVAATGASNETRVQVDANTYATIATVSENITLKNGQILTVSTSKETKSYYTYETELNDAKRTIKILKSEFVNKLENELKRVLA